MKLIAIIIATLVSVTAAVPTAIANQELLDAQMRSYLPHLLSLITYRLLLFYCFQRSPKVSLLCCYYLLSFIPLQYVGGVCVQSSRA